MSLPYQVQNVTAEQADGNIAITWAGSPGAVSYTVNKSTDGVNFTTLASGLTGLNYVDSLPGTGVLFYYTVTAVNGSGSASPSLAASMVAAPPSEMSLMELRLRAQQTADRVNSQFVTTTEWNSFLRLALYELYDLLVGTYEDYGIAPPVLIQTNGSQSGYALPDGVTNYLGGSYNGSSGAPAKALYKLTGVDLGVNTSNNAWVTLNRFNMIDRNKFVYPNSTSQIYGVFNLRYRVLGNNIEFIPIPSGNQTIRLWYIQKLPALPLYTDVTTLGTSGWLRYAIVRAAKYALDKEEGSDTSALAQELMFLKQRIEEMASNRDAGQPDKISETRKDDMAGFWGQSSGGGGGGW
jgi:hypothetical protein